MSNHDDDAADPRRLRAGLHRLTETIEPAPDYLERLRPRLRPARRRRAAGLIAAAALAVAVGAAAVAAGLLAHDRQLPPTADLPRTLVVMAATASPPLDPQLRLRDPKAFSDQASQDARTRETALLRLDTASGQVLSVLYRKRGGDFAWSLRDDGWAVVETGQSACSFDLRAVGPDGQRAALGAVPGFQGNNGGSITSFAFSPDGRLLAVSGTSCPDRGGVLHWRIAVYRVGATVDRRPLLSVTLPDPPDGLFPDPATPSFSADGRHVAFPFETGQGSFDPARGQSGNIVAGFLDVDLDHPASAPARRTLQPSQTRCSVYHDGLRFGGDPSTLITLEGCPGRQYLVSAGLRGGQVRPLLTLPGQPLIFASTPDLDAGRTRLLLRTLPPRGSNSSPALFVWDGKSLRRVLTPAREVEVDGVTYSLATGFDIDAQW